MFYPFFVFSFGSLSLSFMGTGQSDLGRQERTLFEEIKD